MTADEPEAEDVKSLFRKFGGDASGYKEFEPLEDNSAAPAGWALMPGKGLAAALPPEAPAAALAPLQPAAAIPAPSSSTPFAPMAAPRELDLLFARLAGHDTGADSGHRLLSRWRRPS